MAVDRRGTCPVSLCDSLFPVAGSAVQAPAAGDVGDSRCRRDHAPCGLDVAGCPRTRTRVSRPLAGSCNPRGDRRALDRRILERTAQAVAASARRSGVSAGGFRMKQIYGVLLIAGVIALGVILIWPKLMT